MKTKRMISLLLAVLLTLSVAVTPAFAASAGDLLPAAESADVEESNDVVSIRLTTSGELVYGSPFTLSVVTKPADTQYIGVVIGTKGEAKGYVTLVLSDKIRTLLKMIPLPRKMSATPDQQEEFNLYAYIKQLIDGNDVSVLLRVADEVVSVMDVLQFYMPTIKDVSTGLKLALALIRKFLPDGAFSRIYVDEQPTESGNYVAGAVALESGDVNTAGVAMFRIKPKTEGVRTYWTQEVPDTMTVEEAQNYDLSAVLEVDGQPVPEGKTATSDQAQEVCKAIRDCVREMYDDVTAEAVRIQYGGSVNAGNAAELFAKPDIDGGLVGGASLKADFGKIVNYK